MVIYQLDIAPMMLKPTGWCPFYGADEQLSSQMSRVPMSSMQEMEFLENEMYQIA